MLENKASRRTFLKCRQTKQAPHAQHPKASRNWKVSAKLKVHLLSEWELRACIHVLSPMSLVFVRTEHSGGSLFNDRSPNREKWYPGDPCGFNCKAYGFRHSGGLEPSRLRSEKGKREKKNNHLTRPFYCTASDFSVIKNEVSTTLGYAIFHVW